MLVKSDPFEVASNGALRSCAADLRALEDAIVKAGDDHEAILLASEDAAEFFPRLHSTLREHIARLDSLIGPRDDALPKPGTDSPPVPNQPVPAKAPVRDACALLCEYGSKLNLAAIGYTMLHARSVALHDANTAKLALTHLQELVPFFQRITEAAPRLAVQELTRHFGGLTPGAAEIAVRNTQDVWSQGTLTASVH